MSATIDQESILPILYNVNNRERERERERAVTVWLAPCNHVTYIPRVQCALKWSILLSESGVGVCEPVQSVDIRVELRLNIRRVKEPMLKCHVHMYSVHKRFIELSVTIANYSTHKLVTSSYCTFLP